MHILHVLVQEKHKMRQWCTGHWKVLLNRLNRDWYLRRLVGDQVTGTEASLPGATAVPAVLPKTEHMDTTSQELFLAHGNFLTTSGTTGSRGRALLLGISKSVFTTIAQAEYCESAYSHVQGSSLAVFHLVGYLEL